MNFSSYSYMTVSAVYLYIFRSVVSAVYICYFFVLLPVFLYDKRKAFVRLRFVSVFLLFLLHYYFHFMQICARKLRNTIGIPSQFLSVSHRP